MRYIKKQYVIFNKILFSLMTIVKIYIQEDDFIAIKRSELRGYADFLVNCD